VRYLDRTNRNKVFGAKILTPFKIYFQRFLAPKSAQKSESSAKLV